MFRLAMCGLTLAFSATLARSETPTKVSPDPASLAVPSEQQAKAQELVRKLGSEDYLDRDRAARELSRMGRLALAALDASRDNADPEVRLRVMGLLPRAEADELRARIASFLADTEAKYFHDLPGLHRFRIIAGDDRETRDLYADILKNTDNFDLLLAIRGTPSECLFGLSATASTLVWACPETPPAQELNFALSNRRFQIQNQMNQPGRVAVGGVYRPNTPEIPDVALMLIAEALTSESKSPFNPVHYQISNILYQENIQPAVTGKGKYGPAFRRLVIYWMESRDGLYGLSNAMNHAQRMQLGPQVVNRFASKMLAIEGGQPWNRANAATMIARNGGKEHLLAITRLFNDEALLIRGGPNNPQPDIQVRDSGLAMALQLSGQDPKTYGMDSQYPGNEAMKFQYTNFRFQSDESLTAEVKRDAAFAKWRTWESGLHGSLIGSGGAAAIMSVRYPDKNRDK